MRAGPAAVVPPPEPPCNFRAAGANVRGVFRKVGARMTGFYFWALAALAATLVGLSKGGMPVVAMLSVPVLSLVISPVTAAGLLLPVYVASDVFGLYAYRERFDRRILAILAPAATVGVGIGWATAAITPEWLVTGLVGLIGAAFALRMLLARGEPAPAREPRVGPGLFWGTICGITSFVSHSGAPPFQIYVQPMRLDKAVFAGTLTVLFAYINAIKIVPYWALGQLSLDNLGVAAVLAPIAAAAVYAGVWLVRVMPQDLFYKFVTWALLIVSAKLLYDGAHGWLAAG